MLNDYGYSRKNGKNQSERKSHSITPYPLLTSLQGIQQSYRGGGGGGGGNHRISNQQKAVQCHISLAYKMILTPILIRIDIGQSGLESVSFNRWIGILIQFNLD